jgi:hypothetical protein
MARPLALAVLALFACTRERARPQPTAPAPTPVAQEPAIQLTVLVQGERETVWTGRDLARAPSMAVLGDSGDGKRLAWPLRGLVTALVGPNAVATALTGEGGRRVQIDAQKWRDTSHVPVLRLNRRGQLKFHWARPDGAPEPGEDLRAVTKIEIARAPG